MMNHFVSYGTASQRNITRKRRSIMARAREVPAEVPRGGLTPRERARAREARAVAKKEAPLTAREVPAEVPQEGITPREREREKAAAARARAVAKEGAPTVREAPAEVPREGLTPRARARARARESGISRIECSLGGVILGETVQALFCAFHKVLGQNLLVAGGGKISTRKTEKSVGCMIAVRLESS